jgi:multidrug efflux pump subunit AcrA (membrane-fusion protein)
MRGGARGWIATAVWALAALAAVVLWMRSSVVGGGLPAVVDAQAHQLGPVEAGRLVAVLVAAGDDVSPGQVVARMDTTDIDAELEVQKALLTEYVAEVEATSILYAEESRDRRLSVSSDLAKVRAALAEARGQEAARQAEIGALRGELERLDAAMRDRLTVVDKLGEMKARQESLSNESRYAPAALKAWSDLARQVESTLSELGEGDFAKRLGPFRARAETQSRRVQQLIELRERRTIRSPVLGRVTSVLRAAGDSVGTAEPFIRIAPLGSQRVTAYLPEEQARGVGVGTPIEAIPRDRTATLTAAGVVERLGAEIVLLPMQLWVTPEQPRYGRPVHVRLTGDAQLLPGEIVSVHVRATGGAQAAPTTVPGPAAIVVPDALRARSRLEPSGAVWVPALERLLVVSDDTGLAGPDEHSPLVFSATADGRFDEAPLRVDGVDSVSDLEAVTRSDDGTFYLVTSQSRSSKGKRPTKRQWLLRARLEGRVLRVTGKTHLFARLERELSDEARAELGVGPDLDIEGATWRNGDLLLGLKAPIDRDGRAVVWRLADVDAMLDGDKAPVVTRFLDVSLPTEGAPGGISELYLEGDRLYLLSTLPEGPAAGAAWRLDLSKAGAAPERLGRWPGAKPEAIARAGDGRLVVFFDGGDDGPSRVDHITEP